MQVRFSSSPGEGPQGHGGKCRRRGEGPGSGSKGPQGHGGKCRRSWEGPGSGRKGRDRAGRARSGMVESAEWVGKGRDRAGRARRGMVESAEWAWKGRDRAGVREEAESSPRGTLEPRRPRRSGACSGRRNVPRAPCRRPKGASCGAQRRRQSGAVDEARPPPLAGSERSRMPRQPRWDPGALPSAHRGMRGSGDDEKLTCMLWSIPRNAKSIPTGADSENRVCRIRSCWD